MWPLISLVLGGICIAFAPIFVRLADVGPVSVVMWRLGLSIPFVLLLVSKLPSVTLVPASKRAWAWLVISGVLLAADLALWHISIHQTSVANSTFLINLAPIFVTLGAFLFLNESIGVGFSMALVAAIGGAALLVNGADFGNPAALQGDLTAITAAVFYAGYQLTVKYCRRYFPVPIILAVTAIVTTVVLLPTVIMMGEVILPRSLAGWAVVIGIAVVCQVMGQGLITWAVAHTKANMASVVLLVQPVVAAWLAMLIWGETLTAWQLMGCALVLAGIVMARRSSR